MSDADQQPAGLEFPCDYPVKAMGRTEDEFRDQVVEIVQRHVGPVKDDQIRSRSSSAGNFQSITVTVHVETRAQLESIYTDLAACEQVLWTL